MLFRCPGDASRGKGASPIGTRINVPSVSPWQAQHHRGPLDLRRPVPADLHGAALQVPVRAGGAPQHLAAQPGLEHPHPLGPRRLPHGTPGAGSCWGEPWSQQGQGVVTGRCWGGFGCDCKTHPEHCPVAATSKTVLGHGVTDARLGGGWHRAAEMAWGRWLARVSRLRAPLLTGQPLLAGIVQPVRRSPLLPAAGGGWGCSRGFPPQQQRHG